MKRQNNRFAILAALLCVALASCSKDPIAEPTLSDGEIRLSAVVAGEEQTKAPVVDGAAGAKAVLTGIHFLQTDGAATQTDFSGVTARSGNRDASGAITFATPPTYAKTDDKAWLMAYYPTTSADGATVTTGQKVVWTINGKTDILLSSLDPAASYDAGKYTAPETGTMTFKHALAQLQVIVKAVHPDIAPLAVVQSSWGTISKIELLTSPMSMTYTYATNALTYGVVGAQPLLKSDYNTAFAAISIPANSSTTVNAAGMYAPSTGVIYLRITTSKFPGGVEIPVQLKNALGTNCNFDAGKRYTVTLALGADDKQLDIKSTISDWSTGYAADNTPSWGGPRIGSYYYTDGTVSWDLTAGKTVEGVVFWVNPVDPWHFKIVALDEPPANWDEGTNQAGYLVWSTEFLATGASSASYGKSNTLTLMMRDNAPTAYPAAKWCYTRNTGLSIPAPESAATTDANYKWYLPAKDELQHIFCAYRGAAPTTWANGTTGAPAAAAGYPDAWNARFTTTPFASTAYWSSTEGGGAASWYVGFSNGSTLNATKTATSYRTRCVREINAPPTPQVEDYYYTDGTYSRELNSAKTVEGVIFWVDAIDPWHFKIVAMDEPPANWEGTNQAGYLVWSTEFLTTGASSTADGKANTLTLMKLTNATLYKAAKWCYSKNSGLSIPAASSAATSDANYKWYLPAKDELQHIFCAYRGAAPTTWANGTTGVPPAAAGYPDAWNARFTTTPFASAYYWSSSEAGGTTSWAVYLGSGYTNNNEKTLTNLRISRCVREIIY